MSKLWTQLRRLGIGLRTVEIVAVLAAGIGLGIGIAALAFSHKTTTTRSTYTATAHRSAASSQPLPAASAGVQPGRTEVPASNEPSNEQQGTPTSDSSTLLPGAVSSFHHLARNLPGRIEVTVEPLGVGKAENLGANLPAHGWSTTKVPVLAALLKARGNQGLSATEEGWAHAAITESSNEAILDIFKTLEQTEGGLLDASTYVQSLLEISGDDTTKVATAPPPPGAVTTFGQTEWRPSDAVKFFSALGRACLGLPTAANSHLLSLMQSIVPSESWGLGSAGFDHVAFKGGWGPESSGYLVRQSGIIEVGKPSAVAVSIVYFAGTFAEGQTALTETADWLRRHLRLVSRPALVCNRE